MGVCSSRVGVAWGAPVAGQERPTGRWRGPPCSGDRLLGFGLSGALVAAAPVGFVDAEGEAELELDLVREEVAVERVDTGTHQRPGVALAHVHTGRLIAAQ